MENEFFIAINVFFFFVKNSKRSNFYKNQNFTKRITPQCSPMIILYVVNFCAHKIKTPCILIIIIIFLLYYIIMYYITIVIYFITILTYYVSQIIYYIDITIDYNKRYILIIILIIYYITKTEHLYPLKHSFGTALSPSLSSVYSYFTYMIGLTKRSHVAPKMQHVFMQHFWQKCSMFQCFHFLYNLV